MKMHQITKQIKKMVAVLAICLTSTALWAQDGGADLNVNINKGDSGGWYTQPWVWIVGGAVFLLLLVALLRGGGNKN